MALPIPNLPAGFITVPCWWGYNASSYRVVSPVAGRLARWAFAAEGDWQSVTYHVDVDGVDVSGSITDDPTAAGEVSMHDLVGVYVRPGSVIQILLDAGGGAHPNIVNFAVVP